MSGKTPALKAGAAADAAVDLTDDEILSVFPQRGVVVDVESMWKMLGSPTGKEGLLKAAMLPLPPRYASSEAAQAAGAPAGARSAHLLAQAAIAVFANRKGLKPGSKLPKLEKDFADKLPQYFALCKVKMKGYN
jgi:hypothetical protein